MKQKIVLPEAEPESEKVLERFLKGLDWQRPYRKGNREEL